MFIADTLDKVEIFNEHPFDVVFIGSDWKGHPRWLQTENDLQKVGATVEYLQYTQRVSSSGLRSNKDERVKDRNEEK